MSQSEYDKRGSYDQSRNFEREKSGIDYKAQDYMGSGTKAKTPDSIDDSGADYKSYTKEDYQNLNARNVGNPTPSQAGKYEQKTGQFGMYSQDANMPEGARVHSYAQDNWKKNIQEGSGQHDTRTMENTREHDESVKNTGQRQDYSKKVLTPEQQRAQEAQQQPKQFKGKDPERKSVQQDSERPTSQDFGRNI